MERYQKLIFVNLKHNLWIPALLVFILCLLSPVAIGLENLNVQQTAKVIEVFLSLTGIIFLMTVFSPDIDRDIRDIVASKKEPMLLNHLLRILCALFFLSAVGLLFLLWMIRGGCQFPFGKMFFCFLANSVFLGGLGAFFFSLSNQPVLGYMASILYFLLNFGAGKKYMGNLFLFSMQYGSFQEKYYLMAGGIAFLLLAIIWRDVV
ncbi:hypothetical protein [Anaerocolumna xylanovorans]|uniref:ABC-2 family transporter protein n=1 Tax=Anaerocolumna xylanovorans DSM 12503 TaxID=1121345 RepID=A0A1M7YKZ2_9FIRM|nr:hypothetical protein [Anaerocolumna xylanovorans]SHO53264.1 hypothetical protein SAMN02745217_04029 [Anaerocolumna xylanovorans DSM 12503]